jgi:putative flavoprotein involved in K+ transport
LQLSCFLAITDATKLHMKKKVIIIGAGAAGIGMGIVLQRMDIDFLILEKNTVGSSFLSWPPGTRLISPSFTGNFFGVPDLNSLTPESSPAYTLKTEHPTGPQFAQYLKDLAQFYVLPILENRNVKKITKKADLFTIKTEKYEYIADFVIWAGGEYQFPKTNICEGFEHGIHNTKIEDWKKMKGDIFPIIGGYESGFDTAIQLAKAGKKSIIFDSKDHLNLQQSDSSISLSPFTKDRYQKYKDQIKIKTHTRITKIEKHDDQYILHTNTGEFFQSKSWPILATGFQSSLIHIKDLFNWNNGIPKLTDSDESTRTPGLFLVGPQVQHDNVIFCFIYKFRQRFAVVAEEITTRLRMKNNELVQNTIQDYEDGHFYLKDLSCCGDECVC